MPHLVIEYSAQGHGDFDIGELMQAIHVAAAATGVMQAADLKIRASCYQDYLVAGRRDGFCHLTVSMLEGRSAAQKIAVSEALRATLAAQLPLTKSLSVDIRDMDASAYKKRLHPDLP